MRKLQIEAQLIKKGTVLWIPEVDFGNGVIKSKYCVTLEDSSSFWQNGNCLLACLTTSRRPGRLKPWQVAVGPGYKILGEGQTEVTYIDCRNRLKLAEKKIKKCKFISFLPDEIMVLVQNANEIAELYERLS